MERPSSTPSAFAPSETREPFRQRESELLSRLRRGDSIKRIAIELGRAPSSISNAVRALAAKRGARSRVELVRSLVGGAPVDAPWQARLTPAERAVATLLLEGASNAEIAHKRNTSVRTVANQVAAIFRKAQVGSRVELAARAFDGV
jgi:DNA-binding NarL/FixJ family response regulator